MIPKVFHHIWINSHDPELPKKFSDYRETWIRLHPDWEFKLWNLDNLDFTPRRMDIIRSATNYAQMADILRYEILFRHGGVYVDTDFDCLRNIDPILNGVKNFSCSEDGRNISIGIMGAEAGSVYMDRCIQSLPQRIGIKNTAEETGPGLLTQVILGQGINNDFTLFPKIWFYPYGYNETHRANEEFPNSYAVHHWANSWGAGDRKFMTKLRRNFNKMTQRFRAM